MDDPLQFVRLDKIENLPTSAVVTKRGLEQFAEIGVEPETGAFHGARLGRQIDTPIALKANIDGTFSITDGMHRASQAEISNDDVILAFVDGGSGPSLKEIFDLVKGK